MTGMVSTVLVLAGVLAAAVGVATTRTLAAGLTFMLDLWIAAGLLRLSLHASWPAIASAAVLIAIRKLVATALALSTRARRA